MLSSAVSGMFDRQDFSKIRANIDIPDLIEIQKRSYEQFLQMECEPNRREDKGLQAALSSVFPIADYNNTAELEFVYYVLGTPKILSGRVVLLGLKTEYRNRGLFPLFAYEAARRALEVRAEGAEASWILADNESIVAPLEAMGLAAYKRWRIYEK